MTEVIDRSMSMLKTALEIESKGKKFYEEAQATCKNEVGREVFQMLRDYEIQHMDRITAIYNALKGGQVWSEELAEFPVAVELGRVFRELAEKSRGEIKADSTDLEALKVGIDFESTSVNFYEEQLPLALDPLEKRFLELMIEEERSHLNLLTDMEYYYRDPEGWLMEKDRSILDGA